MSVKKMLLVAACLGLSACSSVDTSSGDYMNGRPHPLADNSSVYSVNRGHQDREPCQMYERDIAKMAYVPSCMRVPLVAVAEVPVVYAAPAVAPAPAPAPDPNRLLPITRSYPIYFDFDKSNIKGDGQQTIDSIVRDMQQYHPPQVTVTGHTDRAGPATYNQRLSEKRAEAVSQALTEHGIENRIINEQARGESETAVPTADGVPEQANRRAMIDFRGEALVKGNNP